MNKQEFIESYQVLEKNYIINKYYQLYCGPIWNSIKKNISDSNFTNLILTVDNIKSICKKYSFELDDDDSILKNEIIYVNDFINYLVQNTSYRKGLFFLNLSETETYLVDRTKDNNIFQTELKDFKRNMIQNLDMKSIEDLKDFILNKITSDKNTDFLYKDIDFINALDENNKPDIISLFTKKAIILYYFEKSIVDLDAFYNTCTSEEFLSKLGPMLFSEYLESINDLIFKSINGVTRNLREVMYDVINNLIESTIFKNENDEIDKEYKYYPNYFNKQFNQIIYNKKEFNNCKTEKSDFISINPTDSFKKTNTQRFIQNFLHPQTPYNGIFLWHGVGSGKTCTGITVAENFRNVMFNLKKKILILLPNNTLEENWYNEIFNINKEIDNSSGSDVQCTGDIYTKYYNNLNKIPSIIDELQIMETSKLSLKLNKLSSKYTDEKDEICAIVEGGNRTKILDKLINIYKIENKKKLKNKIKKYINSFYEISTYRILTNKLEKEFKNFFTETDKINYIQTHYSDRIIIMDEIHSARDVDRVKKGSIYLEMIARYGINNKMILLSATPIYDTLSEILFIINLLLLNDKRGILRKKNIFEDNIKNSKDEKKKSKDENELIESLKKGAMEILNQKTRGYISYLRGQNPFTYPIKLWPDNNKFLPDFFETKPYKSFKDNFVKNDSLVFYENKLSDYHSKSYVKLQEKLGSTKNKKLGQICNITYPNELTFNEVFTKDDNIYSINNDVPEDFPKDFLKLENIQQYSTKIYNIVNEIIKSKGIVFVHSEYVDTGHGILPLAFVLENAGFDRYNGSKKDVNFIVKNRDKDDCYCSINKKYYKDISDKKTFIQAKYIYLTGKDVNKKLLNELIEQTRSDDNTYGKNIMVVLGSDVITQGVSFFNIRQMHIMSPWWNFSKIEQITGRGMRNFSHKNLPESQRNITIFLHVSTIDSKVLNIQYIENNIITLDEYMYKISFQKKLETAGLEFELKKISIDCALNFHSNSFLQSSYNEEYNIEDSSGNKRLIKIHDKDYSFECDLSKCLSQKAKCNININDKADNHTSFNVIEKNTQYIQEIIEKLYDYKLFYKLEEIIKKLDLEKKESNKLYIYIALNDMIYKKKKFFIYDIKNSERRKGYLIYRDKFYIFQPVFKDSLLKNFENLPLTYRNKSNYKKTEDYTRVLSNKSIKKKKHELDLSIKTKPINHWINFIKSTDKWINMDKYTYDSFIPQWSGDNPIKTDMYRRMIYISYIERLSFDDKVNLFSNGLVKIIQKIKSNSANPNFTCHEFAFLDHFSKNKRNERNFEYCIFYNTPEERQKIKITIQTVEINNLPIFFRLKNKAKEFKNFMYDETTNKFTDSSFNLKLPKPETLESDNKNNIMSGYIVVKENVTSGESLFKLKYNKSGTVDKTNKKKNIKYSVCGSGTDVKGSGQMIDFLDNALVGNIQQDGKPIKYSELTDKNKKPITSKKQGIGKTIGLNNPIKQINTLCLEIEILLRIRQYFRSDDEIQQDYYYMLPCKHE